MENGSKALLIVASILIVIILISAGVLLIRNISETNNQSKEVKNSISASTGEATSDVIGGLKAVVISKEKFNAFVNNWSYTKSSDVKKAISKNNGILSNQIEVLGFVYTKGFNFKESEYYSEYKKGYSIGKYNNILDYIYEHEEYFEKLSNPIENKAGSETLYKVLYNLTGETEKGNRTAWSLWFPDYDEWGYINKMIYILYIKE